MVGEHVGYELCLVRVDDAAPRAVSELAAQDDRDCSVSVAEAEMEITAKAKPFILAEAMRVNAKTTIEIEAGSATEMGGTSATKSILRDNSNYTLPRSTSSSP
jgi:hypothetical protein